MKTVWTSVARDGKSPVARIDNGINKSDEKRKDMTSIPAEFTVNVFNDTIYPFLPLSFFTVAQKPKSGPRRLLLEVSRSHSDTPHSVEFLWASDQSAAETFT
jgi:hypothetical protein